MKKILIIGNAGAGKTTFARKLSRKTNIPLIHLDKLFWCGKWEHVSRDEFDVMLGEVLLGEEWIIDGNFNRTLPKRLEYCDAVFYFDFSAVACLWGATERVLANYGKTRDDMGGECPEYFDKNKIELYQNILKFNKNHRAAYYEMLEKSNAQVVVFKNRKDVRRYIESI